MTAQPDDHVEWEVRIAARPETIFPFFTDPEKMVLWKGTTATLDPRPGGIYRVNVTGRDIARGEYVEVTPYTRVVFTWGWEGEGNPVPPRLQHRRDNAHPRRRRDDRAAAPFWDSRGSARPA